MSSQSDEQNRGRDGRYTFRIRSSSGGMYARRLYWQKLHVFLLRRRRILTAARMAPHCDMLFAMYLVLKRKGTAIHHDVLPQLPAPAVGQESFSRLGRRVSCPCCHPERLAARRGELCEGSRPAEPTERRQVGPSVDQESISIARIMEEIAPYRDRALPSELLDQAGLALQQAVAQTLNDYAAPVVNLSVIEQVAPLGRPLGRPPRPVGGGLGMLGALTDDDVARVSLSFEVDRAIGDRMDEIARAGVAALPAARAMVVQNDLRSGLRERLYGDPQYLRFVQWVMAADGSFVSPVVRDFMRFYYQRIADRARDLSRRGEFDPEFWQERLLAVIGEGEAEVSRTRPYWDITVLGRVAGGEVPILQFNPDDSGRSYQVDPNFDPAGILLTEVEGRLQRTKVSLRIRLAFDGNIERIRFADETHGEES